MYSRFEWTPASLSRNHILRAYEPLQPFIMLALLERLDVDRFLDIGANIGTYTLMASTLRIAHLHAFEANPETLAELQRNVVGNGLESAVHVHGLALSDHTGRVTFGIVTPLSGENGVIETSIHDTGTFLRTIDVECRPLDTVLTTRQECIAIKLDVEGHELNVLRGGIDLLTHNDVLLQVECYGENVSVSGFLLELGFRRLFHIGPDHYFLKSTCDFTSADAVELFEQAAMAAIEESTRPRPDVPLRVQSSTLRRKVLPGVTVEFGGRAAQLLRSLWGRAVG
jgi:FkbM family methyltransferase